MSARDSGFDTPCAIESAFNKIFKPFGICLPPSNVALRERGKINSSGWVIWYVFGADADGEYLDYYASHRMAGDRHTRILANGTRVRLPAIRGLRKGSKDPVEDADLKTEHRRANQRVLQMLGEKGFCLEGDEPASVAMSWYLCTQEQPVEGRSDT